MLTFLTTTELYYNPISRCMWGMMPAIVLSMLTYTNEDKYNTANNLEGNTVVEDDAYHRSTATIVVFDDGNY